MIIRVRTTLRATIDKMPAPIVALMLDQGWLTQWPWELTRLGKQMAQVHYTRR